MSRYRDIDDLPPQYREQVRQQLGRAHRSRAGDLDVTLPLDWPSRNVVDRMHWSRRGALRKAAEGVLVAHGLCWPDVPGGESELVLTRILGRGQRLYDDDNLVGGAKQLIDAMVRCGWFADDSPAHLSVVCRQDASRRAAGPAVRAQVRRRAG